MLLYCVQCIMVHNSDKDSTPGVHPSLSLIATGLNVAFAILSYALWQHSEVALPLNTAMTHLTVTMRTVCDCLPILIVNYSSHTVRTLAMIWC